MQGRNKWFLFSLVGLVIVVVCLKLTQNNPSPSTATVRPQIGIRPESTKITDGAGEKSLLSDRMGSKKQNSTLKKLQDRQIVLKNQITVEESNKTMKKFSDYTGLHLDLPPGFYATGQYIEDSDTVFLSVADGEGGAQIYLTTPDNAESLNDAISILKDASGYTPDLSKPKVDLATLDWNENNGFKNPIYYTETDKKTGNEVTNLIFESTDTGRVFLVQSVGKPAYFKKKEGLYESILESLKFKKDKN